MKPILSALDDEGRPRSWVADIEEGDPRWPELKPYIVGRLNFIGTKFTDEERLSAEWCTLRGCGILRPNEPVGGYWSRRYYDDICLDCGSGWTQVAPFCLAKEPKLGRNAFASFGGDELFARNEVLAKFKAEGIRGIETRPVLVEKTGNPAVSLEQILVTHVAEPAIADDFVEHEHYRWTDCSGCGCRWHLYYNRGMLPLRRLGLRTDVDFQMTNEWFGSGAAARREILVSNRVVRLILENQWKGADLSPVQIV
jgi:hypothetical protein